MFSVRYCMANPDEISPRLRAKPYANLRQPRRCHVRDSSAAGNRLVVSRISSSTSVRRVSSAASDLSSTGVPIGDRQNRNLVAPRLPSEADGGIAVPSVFRAHQITDPPTLVGIDDGTGEAVVNFTGQPHVHMRI